MALLKAMIRNRLHVIVCFSVNNLRDAWLLPARFEAKSFNQICCFFFTHMISQNIESTVFPHAYVLAKFERPISFFFSHFFNRNQFSVLI